MIVRKVRPNRSAIAASARRWSDASEAARALNTTFPLPRMVFTSVRSEEHTSELQSQSNPVCRLLLEIENQHRVRSCQPPRPPPRLSFHCPPVFGDDLLVHHPEIPPRPGYLPARGPALVSATADAAPP